MKYIALMQFQDGATGPIYTIGDTYPAEGHKPTPERISQLASTGNRLGRPAIEMVKEPEAPVAPASGPEQPTEPDTTGGASAAPTGTTEPEPEPEPETPEDGSAAPVRFQCPHCEKDYASESGLANHIKEKHPGTKDE